MDGRWRKTLFQWITECGFLEPNFFNIEQTDIEIFYSSFCRKHPRITLENFPKLHDFLNDFYPEFEANFDNNHCLVTEDYIYVYSLLLHFSCVKHPEEVFHEICQKLTESTQQNLALFFKELLDAPTCTKEVLNQVIGKVAFRQTPHNASIVSSNGSSSSPNETQPDSPFKTPKRNAAAQRTSPLTPKSYLLEERTRELFNLRAQLDTERYEKSLLEIQIKQNEDKILKLNQDHKKLVQQIQDLKNDMLAKTSESLSSHNENEHQLQKRLLKEISQREAEVLDLSNNIGNLREEKTVIEEKLKYAEHQVLAFVERIEDLEYKINDLSNDLEKKDSTIQYLTNNKVELEQFIAEIRQSAMDNKNKLNASNDVLDASFSRITDSLNNSNGNISPESLAVSVVDKQLREKVYENANLRGELTLIQENNKLLADHIEQLVRIEAKEFNVDLDKLSELNICRQNNESRNAEPDPIEKFNILSNCLEKINSYNQIQKSEMLTLQNANEKLKLENRSIEQKMDLLLSNSTKLKESITSLEMEKKDLVKRKEQLECNLEHYKNEFAKLGIEKEEISSNYQTLMSCNSQLSEQLELIKTKLNSQQTVNTELTENNTQLTGQTEGLQNRIQDMQKEHLIKLNRLEEEIENLNLRLTNQNREIESYKNTEKSLKSNYEKIVIENEELKNKQREADAYLKIMKNELQIKTEEVTSLGNEIAVITMKSSNLEERIHTILKAYDQRAHELYLQMENECRYECELKKLQSDLNTARQFLDSKDIEMAHYEDLFNKINPKVNNLLNLLVDSSSYTTDDVCEGLEIVEEKLIKVLKQNSQNQEQLDILEAEKLENNKCIQELNQQITEKDKTIATHATYHEELLVLRAHNIQYEERIEKLKEKQNQFIEKIKNDLARKEEELLRRIEDGKVEHEAAMHRAQQELQMHIDQQTNTERELLLVISELNEAKNKILNSDYEIQSLLDLNHNLRANFENLKSLECQVVESTKQIEVLRQEIDTSRTEMAKLKQRLMESDDILTSLRSEVQIIHQLRSEIDELQKSLDDELQEKATIIQQLEGKKNMELQIQQYMETIQNLKDELQIISVEKERCSKEINSLANQIQTEQTEKALLLGSLEKQADQLKTALTVKSEQDEEHETHCGKLKLQLDHLNQQYTQLQDKIIEREAELRLARDDHQMERQDFESKIEQLVRAITANAEELEAYDTAITEMLAVLENHINLASEPSDDPDMKNLFNAQEEQQKDCNLNQLRNSLNRLLHTHYQLQEQLKDQIMIKEEAVQSNEEMRKYNQEMSKQLANEQQAIGELKQQLQLAELAKENKISSEIKQLQSDLNNLEKVNHHLNEENNRMQEDLCSHENLLTDIKFQMEEVKKQNQDVLVQLQNKTDQMDCLQQEYQRLRQTLQEREKSLESAFSKQKDHRDCSFKLQNLDKELHENKERANKMQLKFNQLQHQHNNLQSEYKKFMEKQKQMQHTIESLEIENAHKSKELLTCKARCSDLQNQRKQIEQELALNNEKLEEAIIAKLNGDSRCDELQSECQQLKRDISYVKSQQQCTIEENSRLHNDTEALRADKVILRNEQKELKVDLQKSNDNVTQLIQQIASIRLEKEGISQENQLLRKQIEETGKHYNSSESRLKTLIESSQSLERKLLSSENVLKSLRVSFEKSEVTVKKLLVENCKLRDSNDAATKRIEKMALRLGDSQARSSKLERENEKMTKTLEANTSTIEALQKEKSLLQTDVKSLKERLSKSERAQDQLNTKVQFCENLNKSLQDTIEKLQNSEIDSKAKINKLEKVKETNEDRVKKLTTALNSSEKTNVELNLEIGGLNSQLQELTTNCAQKDQLNRNLELALAESENYRLLNDKLKTEIDNLNEQNNLLNDQISKNSISITMGKQQYEQLTIDLEQIRTELQVIREAKYQIERDYNLTKEKLEQAELENVKRENISQEREQIVRGLEQRITALDNELEAKSTEVVYLQNDIKEMQANCELQHRNLEESSAHNITELENLHARLCAASEALEAEKDISTQLRLDKQILQSKYQEVKKRLLEATTASEEHIKENRLELEGKLEKMKTKMKNLYTEEITKMKCKQDRELTKLKTELEASEIQNSKYDAHIRKLSEQIVRLNEKILEHQKENAKLSTRLKHLMEHQRSAKDSFRRPNSSIPISTTSTVTTTSTSVSNITSKLAMEDEEGEIFNNTYLADLKAGRMSEYMSRELCWKELSYRNSLLPPHLRSSYAGQFTEDEYKDDAPFIFDDSMSALLSTTVGGSSRKKCSGVTNYKRPGPPTPSKHGGRLSIGSSVASNIEFTREVLKENAADATVITTGSTNKTPARFHFFSSRFSMGGGRDEHIKKQPYLLRKILQSNNTKKKLNNIQNEICTSTPRKSKTNFDQRRLLDKLMSSPSSTSTSPSPLITAIHNSHKNTKANGPNQIDLDYSETPLSIYYRRASDLNRNSKKTIETCNCQHLNDNCSKYLHDISKYGNKSKQSMASLIYSPNARSSLANKSRKLQRKLHKSIRSTSSATSSDINEKARLELRLRRRYKRERVHRPSICLANNIFARSTQRSAKLPASNISLRKLQRFKAHQQRIDIFNQLRNIDGQMLQNAEEEDQGLYNNHLTYNLQENYCNVSKHAKSSGLQHTYLVANKADAWPSDTDTADTFSYEEEEEEADDNCNNVTFSLDAKVKAKNSVDKLITSQDLADFDDFIAGQKSFQYEYFEEQEQGSIERFSKLLDETVSSAPFTINSYNFDDTNSKELTNAALSNGSISDIHHNPIAFNQPSATTYSQFACFEENSSNLDAVSTTATLHHLSAVSEKARYTRTIYGNNIVCNSRLPHINSTYVRKSSLYFRRTKDNSSKELIVLSDHTIITLMDLARMWIQMDNSTRLIVGFAILASITTILSLFISFFPFKN